MKDAIGLHAFFWLYKLLKSCNTACSYPSYSHWWHLKLLCCTIFSSQYVHCSKCIKTYEITPSHATSIQITSRNTPHYYSGKIGHALMLIIRVEIKTSSHFSLLRSSYSGIGTSFLKEPFKSFTHLYKISSHCKPIDDLICDKQTTGACLTVGTTCNNRAWTHGEWCVGWKW